MKEPSITINTIDETIGALVIPPDTRLNILAPVVTPTGPTELTYVRGPADFQRLFFGGSSVTPSSHATARYARALMNYAPIYVKRADNTKLRGGITSNGLTFYTNKIGEPIESAKIANFSSEYSDIITYSIVIGSSKFYMNLGGQDDDTFPPVEGWIYIPSTDSQVADGSIPLSYFLKSISCYLGTPFNDNTLTLPLTVTSKSDTISAFETMSESRYNKLLASGTVEKPYYVSIGDYCYTTDLIYNQTGKTPVLISSVTTGDLVDLTKFYAKVLSQLLRNGPSPDNITKIPTFTIAGITAGIESYTYADIPLNETGYFYVDDSDNIKPLLTSEKLVGSISTPDSGSLDVTDMNPLEALIALTDLTSGTYSNDIEFGWANHYTIGYLKDSPVSYTTAETPYNYFIFKSDEDNIAYRTYSNLSITVTIDGATHVFYIGTTPSGDNLYQLSSTDMSFKAFIEAAIRSMGINIGASALFGEGRVLIPDATTISASGLSVLVTDMNLASTAKFGILPKFPSTSSIMKVSYSILSSDSRVYNMTVSFGSLNEVWQFSFDDTLIDGLGQSLYYQRINDQSQLIDIVELSGTQAAGLPTVDFGNEIKMLDVSDTDIASSLLEIADNDESDVLFDYIVDGSISTSAVAGAISQLMNKYHSFYPVSCDPTASNKNSIIAHRENLGIDTAKAIYPMFGHRSGILGGASIKLPGSFYYMLNVISVANGSQEFRPTFGETNGAVSIDRPIQTFTKTVREELLDHQIITLVRGSSGYYFNLNQTLQRTLSYLSEDQIARMDNKIKQLSDIYARTLIAKRNSSSERSSVESVLGLQLNTRLRAGTENGPVSIRVQCDETNNPTSLINQRQIYYAVYAQYSPSIKEVLVDSRVVPLS